MSARPSITSAFAGPFCAYTIGVCRTDYRRLPDLFSDLYNRTSLTEAANAGCRRRRQSHLQMFFLKNKERSAGCGPPAFAKRSIRKRTDGAVRRAGYAGENQAGPAQFHPPSEVKRSRRPAAARSPRPALGRRSRGDRRSTVLVAQESHRSAMPSWRPRRLACAATPTPDDTLALVPRDRRGAGAGVAADLRRPATRLPHHTACAVATAERSHAAGE
jgi:hypothetical protein